MKTFVLAALLIAAPTIADDTKGTNLSEVPQEGAKSRFFDAEAGAAWTELNKRIQDECKKPNGMIDRSCRSALKAEYRAAGKLRGEGYCEAHWLDLPAAERTALLDAIYAAAGRANSEPLDQSDQHHTGEVFFDDLRVEAQCLSDSFK